MTKESLGNLFADAYRAAGVGKSAHGLRKAAATNAANHGATVAELEAIFGWQGGQMASLYTRSANRRALSASAMTKLSRTETETSIPAPHDKVRAPERGQLSTPLPDANKVATNGENKVVTCVVIFGEKLRNFNYLSVGMVRSEGLEPPRFYSLPPQGSASTNSATSA